MDAAAAGILRGRVDWRRRRSGMPPRFFPFRIARFFLSKRRIFCPDTIDGRGCLPQVCCKAKSIGRRAIDGCGAAGINARPRHLLPLEISDATSVFFGVHTFFFRNAFFLPMQLMDAAAAGILAESIAAGDRECHLVFFLFGSPSFFFQNAEFFLPTRSMDAAARRRYVARSSRLGAARLMDAAPQVFMRGSITCCRLRSAMPPQFFLECTLLSFGMPFFLPTQSMDAAAAGILAESIAAGDRECHLFFSFSDRPLFSFKTQNFFFRHDRWTRPPAAGMLRGQVDWAPRD